MINLRDFFKTRVLTFLLGVTVTVTPLSGIAEAVIDSITPSTKMADMYDDEFKLSSKEDFIIRAEYAMDSCREYIDNPYIEEIDKYATYGGFNLSYMDDEVVYALLNDGELTPNYISEDNLATWMLSQSLLMCLLDSYVASDGEMPLENWFVNHDDYDKFMEIMADGLKYRSTMFGNHCEKCDIDSLEKFYEIYAAESQKALEENDEKLMNMLYLIGFRMYNDAQTPLTKPDSIKTAKSIYDMYRTYSNGRKEMVQTESWKLKKDPEKLNNKEKSVVRFCNVRNNIGKWYKKLSEKLKPLDTKLSEGYVQYQKTNKEH